MADKKENTKKLAEDQNEEGTAFDSKTMISENSDKKTVIKYADRVKVKLLKDTVYQKAGKEYSPHRIKAEALVKQGLAEYVK